MNIHKKIGIVVTFGTATSTALAVSHPEWTLVTALLNGVTNILWIWGDDLIPKIVFVKVRRF